MALKNCNFKMEKSMFMRYTFFIITCFFFSCKYTITYTEGGFDYPREAGLSDSSYFDYPYRDSVNSYDSLMTAEYGKILLKKFHEPNLSIRPQKEIMFRLLYQSNKPDAVFIILTPSKLVIKKSLKGYIYPYFDEKKLSENEKKQLHLTEWYYNHLAKNDTSKNWKNHANSLLKIQPEITDMKYLKLLHDKMATYDNDNFEYAAKTYSLTKKEFEYLVKGINGSGFWNLPKESICHNIPADADGFILEANTQSKYKIVTSACCNDDERKFTIACQEIIRAARLGKEIHLTNAGEAKPTFSPVIVEDNDVSLQPIEIPDSIKYKKKKRSKNRNTN